MTPQQRHQKQTVSLTMSAFIPPKQISYLMVTGSVNSSVSMPALPGSDLFNPPWLDDIKTYLTFDPSGVFYCLIQAFDYTFYHNLVVMSAMPYIVRWFARGASDIGTAMLQISYANKRKIAQDEDEEEFLNEEEGQAIYDLREALNGLQSEFLIFVHPNITDVMFQMIDCQAILGYDNEWLVADFRFQCNGVSISRCIMFAADFAPCHVNDILLVLVMENFRPTKIQRIDCACRIEQIGIISSSSSSPCSQ